MFVNLEVGDFLRIDDDQSLIGSVREEGDEITTKDYKIVSKRSVVAHSADFETKFPIVWYLYEIEYDEELTFTFYVKEIVNDDGIILDQGLFYYPLPDELSREEMVDMDMLWLFDQPDDINCEPCDYELSERPIVPPLNDSEDDVSVSYEMSKYGVMFGKYFSKLDNGREIPMMITEYTESPTQLKNPCMIVIESDYLNDDGNPYTEGGMVDVLLGCSIPSSCVQVIK